MNTPPLPSRPEAFSPDAINRFITQHWEDGHISCTVTFRQDDNTYISYIMFFASPCDSRIKRYQQTPTEQAGGDTNMVEPQLLGHVLENYFLPFSTAGQEMTITMGEHQKNWIAATPHKGREDT